MVEEGLSTPSVRVTRVGVEMRAKFRVRVSIRMCREVFMTMYTLRRSISSKNDQTSSLSALVETLVMIDEEVDHFEEAEAEG